MITLQPIAEENFEEVLELKASEEFVATNAYSLAEAYCDLKVAIENGEQYQKHQYSIPFAIVDDETAVGFLMIGYEDGEDINAGSDIYWLGRFMIDEKHQGKGYGKAAMKLVIDYVKSKPHGYDVKYIFTSVVPNNDVATKLYERMGFIKTGEQFYGEDLMLLVL